jgi:hypothetical protein
MTGERKSWHRDGIPLWGWAAIGVIRLGSLVMALLPVLVLAGGIWWWTHGGAKKAPKFVQQAVERVQKWASGVFGK